MLLLISCGGSKVATTNSNSESADQPNLVELQLYNVENDQVKVVFDPGKFLTETTIFYIPQTVPGTYSTDNYGRLIEALKAFDYDGKELEVRKIDDNSWAINNATELDKIEYLVNDSYDIEGELEIFSPSGTNISANDNFVLNLHGFIGYFKDRTELPYEIEVFRPANMFVSTSLPKQSEEADENTDLITIDTFTASRYFQVTDNPIFYSKTEPKSFQVANGMTAVLDVYSPSGAYTAEQLQPNLDEMMNAQKNYLGAINNTPLYNIILYLSDNSKPDASGFGALEHHTSTVMVLPESIPQDYLEETISDVVSHEFFHTLTPLNVHSEEIHYFDYNNPNMSEHLWMYEGVTEYFANHFQVHEKLFEPQEFYNRMSDKIRISRSFDDSMPFTTMSKNVLEEPYKDQYLNVYEKGALIGMSLDILLRELSNGESGLLQLMGKLSEVYGPDRPFKDEDLIPKIVELTYPEVQDFFDTYITGSTPIPYNEFLAKVGVEEQEVVTETNMFLLNMELPFFDYDETTKVISFLDNLPTNSMLQQLGVSHGDILKEVNGEKYNLNNIRDLIMASMAYEPGQEIVMVVERDGQDVELNEVYTTPKVTQKKLAEMALPESDKRAKLRQAWLFN